jgi:hypothetical protein
MATPGLGVGRKAPVSFVYWVLRWLLPDFGLPLEQCCLRVFESAQSYVGNGDKCRTTAGAFRIIQTFPDRADGILRLMPDTREIPAKPELN